MHRLTAVLLAASALSMVLLGLVLFASPAEGARITDGSPLATSLDIHMSTAPDGPRHSNFLSDTNHLNAVVAYEGAVNEQYFVRLRDLSGIVVKGQAIGPLNGDGTANVRIGVEDFVASYQVNAQAQSAPLQENIDLAHELCGDIPSVPDPWPPRQPTPGPGPTPTPDRYLQWSEAMLNVLERTRSASAELTRTLQAAITLPDLQAELPAAHGDLATARQQLTTANALLAGVPQLLRPSSPPSPTPPPTPMPTPSPVPPPHPDPETACRQVTQAKTLITDAVGKVHAAMNALPADTSTWRVPPTSARYDDGRFVGCLQYKTDLFAMVGSRPRDTAADSALWTVGDPGPPTLMFPSLNLVDPANLGALGLSLPEGHAAIYARSVQVPNANHQARISVFVTDANCIPVDGTTVSVWVGPEDSSGGAAANPQVVTLAGGAAEATLQAGDRATGNRQVTPATLGAWVFACSGPGCLPGQPTPAPGTGPAEQVWGRARFDVVGPADAVMTRLIVRPLKVNRLEDQTAGISMQVRDANGNKVADGTRVRVWIEEEDPGLLAFDRQPLVGGRPSGQPERRVLGKSADLIVEGGASRVPPSEDPGYLNDGRLYMFAGDEGDGFVQICAEADGQTVCADEEVLIVTELKIFLPVSYQGFDVRAEPTYLPVPAGRRAPR